MNAEKKETIKSEVFEIEKKKYKTSMKTQLKKLQSYCPRREKIKITNLDWKKGHY